MKRAFQFLAISNFIAMAAAVGGIERGSIGLAAGGISAVAFLTLAAIFAGMGGMYYHR